MSSYGELIRSLKILPLVCKKLLAVLQRGDVALRPHRPVAPPSPGVDRIRASAVDIVAEDHVVDD